LALSVQKGIYRAVSVESPQSVGLGEGGAVNLRLNAVIADFTLSASASVASQAGGAVYPRFPWWQQWEYWGPEYVRNRLAERAAAREAKARYIDAYAIPPALYAEGRIAYRDPPTATVRAVAPLPTVTIDAEHLHVAEILRFTGPVTEKEAALIAAITLLAA
jgi:hypothetical protein